MSGYGSMHGRREMEFGARGIPFRRVYGVPFPCEREGRGEAQP